MQGNLKKKKKKKSLGGGLFRNEDINLREGGREGYNEFYLQFQDVEGDVVTGYPSPIAVVLL